MLGRIMRQINRPKGDAEEPWLYDEERNPTQVVESEGLQPLRYVDTCSSRPSGATQRDSNKSIAARFH